MTTTSLPTAGGTPAPAPTPPAASARLDDAPRRRRSSPRAILLNVALLAGLAASLGPLVWMVVSSVKPEGEIRQFPPTLIPDQVTWTNYTELFASLNFPRYFLNSVVVALVVTVGSVLFSAMVGYALAKLDFPGRRALFALVMGTLMVPGMVTFVPLFVLVANLDLINTYAALVLPFLAAPFGVFLMRQFMLDVPDELLDAARVDGAGEFRTFFRIVLPQTRPALATLGILTFLGSWNNFLWPLVAVQSADKYTLPVALALYSTGQNTVQYGLLVAGATVIVLPILIVFLALQRHIVQGISTTGLK
ncbi:carbohydrate ABC transporter permease [Promicromonospora soli]|uniref:Sugar ABC transporter permease n=1 Tax=Promicromonospora soli TaxID=2035533 RepID=A0A919KN33_9MICO|nr:carbohydrate ABC transporter permease [Promicromonospora soli]GHH65952.1 sugar ABC transporter permease [Promicromonospora soli]